MASDEEKLEDLLSCPICLEDFTDTGETVPRTLPCPHKLCTGCLKKLLEQVKRECPFCRKVLDQDIRKFPQDKFVIAYVKKERKQEKREAKSTCHKHGMELILFCRDDKVAICQKCLIESHNGHNLIEMEEMEREERENLLQRVGTLKSGIAEKKQALEKAKEELVNKADKSVANLKKEKQKVMENFNDMIKKVEDTKTKEVKGINSALDTLEDIRVMCDSLSDNTGRESRPELLTKIETLSDIERNAGERFSGAQHFTYHEYHAPELTPEATCGRISEGTITADLSKGNVPRDVPMPEAMPVPRHVPGNVPMPVLRDVGFKYKVKKRISVDVASGFDMTPLDATSVLVLGWKQDAPRTLARVNVQTGEVRLVSVETTGWVFVMTTVELGGRKVLALFEGLSKEIEFRDVETLQVISTHSVAPHEPWTLCVSSPSTLLYEDCSQKPRQVHILDCSGAKPRHVRVINTEIDWIRDMCVVKNGGEELLVCVGATVVGDADVGSGIMTAQDLRTGEVKWRVDEEGFEECLTPCSVTSDGGGHVYICYGERNIQTFHVSDGRYLGEGQMALDVLQEQGITRPCNVRWNSADSSLVVYHRESVDGVNRHYISVVRIE